jgi:hypothetical protein
VDGWLICVILCAPSSSRACTASSRKVASILQIVESHRTGDQVRQRVIATLGRLDELEACGQLDRLLRSRARFVRQSMVLDAARGGDAPAVAVRRIGPALLFERLWQETWLPGLDRGSGAQARLSLRSGTRGVPQCAAPADCSGSDLAADRWRQDYRIAGGAWLGEALPAEQQDGTTRFAPRCTKDLIEEQLFAHRRDLFSRLDLMFMDTTSLYFEGLGGQSIGQYSYSKDHRLTCGR